MYLIYYDISRRKCDGFRLSLSLIAHIVYLSDLSVELYIQRHVFLVVLVDYCYIRLAVLDNLGHDRTGFACLQRRNSGRKGRKSLCTVWQSGSSMPYVHHFGTKKNLRESL